jgi:hypothetical protein
MILAHAGVARNIRNVVAQAQHSKHDHSHNRVGDSMQKFNDGKSEEQVLDEVLRDYLLRCYATVSKQYQPIEDMAPQQGVDYLYEMRNEGRITICLHPVGDLVECTISPAN